MFKIFCSVCRIKFRFSEKINWNFRKTIRTSNKRHPKSKSIDHKIARANKINLKTNHHPQKCTLARANTEREPLLAYTASAFASFGVSAFVFPPSYCCCVRSPPFLAAAIKFSLPRFLFWKWCQSNLSNFKFNRSLARDGRTDGEGRTKIIITKTEGERGGGRWLSIVWWVVVTWGDVCLFCECECDQWVGWRVCWRIDRYG